MIIFLILHAMTPCGDQGICPGNVCNFTCKPIYFGALASFCIGEGRKDNLAPRPQHFLLLEGGAAKGEEEIKEWNGRQGSRGFHPHIYNPRTVRVQNWCTYPTEPPVPTDVCI